MDVSPVQVRERGNLIFTPPIANPAVPLRRHKAKPTSKFQQPQKILITNPPEAAQPIRVSRELGV